MTYTTEFIMSAVVIYIFVLFFHLNRKKVPFLHNKLFTFMVSICLTDAVVSVFEVYGNNNPGLYPLWLSNTLSFVYFLLLTPVAFLYALYIMSFDRNQLLRHDRVKKLLLCIPYLIAFLMVVTNFFTGFVFYYDAQGIYHRGTLQMLLYPIMFFYGLLGAVLAARLKSSSRQLVFSLFSMFIGLLVAVVVQYFVPSLLIQHFCISLCTLLILIAVQKPTDGLNNVTGTFSRNTFERALSSYMETSTPSLLVVIYIEDYRLVRKTFGIEFANRIMAQVGRQLELLAGQNVYSITENIFSVLVNRDDAVSGELAAKISRRFDKCWISGGNSISMTARILSLNIPEEANTVAGAEEYIEYLCGDKISSGSVISCKDVNLKDRHRTLEVESAIRRAIKNDGFEVYYQPIYCTKTKRMTSAEALLRLNDPELGSISPSEFIPIAEDNGMILKIGEIVYEKTLKFILRNPLSVLGLKYIEINLSVVQCMQNNLAETLVSLLNRYKIDSSCVNLEITETAAARSSKTLQRNMNALYNYGFSFSLDDYGTGYSNINSLVDLPLEIIKLDKSMLDKAMTVPNGQVVLRGSIAMINQMNLKILVEGVETQEQIDLLGEMNIDYIQGYYFSKPLPAEEFADYIRNFNGIVKE